MGILLSVLVTCVGAMDLIGGLGLISNQLVNGPNDEDNEQTPAELEAIKRTIREKLNSVQRVNVKGVTVATDGVLYKDQYRVEQFDDQKLDQINRRIKIIEEKSKNLEHKEIDLTVRLDELERKSQERELFIGEVNGNNRKSPTRSGRSSPYLQPVATASPRPQSAQLASNLSLPEICLQDETGSKSPKEIVRQSSLRVEAPKFRPIVRDDEMRKTRKRSFGSTSSRESREEELKAISQIEQEEMEHMEDFVPLVYSRSEPNLEVALHRHKISPIKEANCPLHGETEEEEEEFRSLKFEKSPEPSSGAEVIMPWGDIKSPTNKRTSGTECSIEEDEEIGTPEVEEEETPEETEEDDDNFGGNLKVTKQWIDDNEKEWSQSQESEQKTNEFQKISTEHGISPIDKAKEMTQNFLENEKRSQQDEINANSNIDSDEQDDKNEMDNEYISFTTSETSNDAIRMPSASPSDETISGRPVEENNFESISTLESGYSSMNVSNLNEMQSHDSRTLFETPLQDNKKIDEIDGPAEEKEAEESVADELAIEEPLMEARHVSHSEQRASKRNEREGAPSPESFHPFAGITEEDDAEQSTPEREENEDIKFTLNEKQGDESEVSKTTTRDNSEEIEKPTDDRTHKNDNGFKVKLIRQGAEDKTDRELTLLDLEEKTPSPGNLSPNSGTRVPRMIKSPGSNNLRLLSESPSTSAAHHNTDIKSPVSEEDFKDWNETLPEPHSSHIALNVDVDDEYCDDPKINEFASYIKKLTKTENSEESVPIDDNVIVGVTETLTSNESELNATRNVESPTRPKFAAKVAEDDLVRDTYEGNFDYKPFSQYLQEKEKGIEHYEEDRAQEWSKSPTIESSPSVRVKEEVVEYYWKPGANKAQEIKSERGDAALLTEEGGNMATSAKEMRKKKSSVTDPSKSFLESERQTEVQNNKITRQISHSYLSFEQHAPGDKQTPKSKNFHKICYNEWMRKFPEHNSCHLTTADAECDSDDSVTYAHTKTEPSRESEVTAMPARKDKSLSPPRSPTITVASDSDSASTTERRTSLKDNKNRLRLKASKNKRRRSPIDPKIDFLQDSVFPYSRD